jgi:hypothetical protein
LSDPQIISLRFASPDLLEIARLQMTGELNFERVADDVLEVDVTDLGKVSDFTRKLRSLWYVIVSSGAGWHLVYVGDPGTAYDRFDAISQVAPNPGKVYLTNGKVQVKSIVDGVQVRRFR